MEDDDEVVEELDVYFCNKDALGAQLYVLQHPLRPEWSPYDTENAAKIRFKPESKKLEMEIPAEGREGTEFADTAHGETLKLSASEVDGRTTFCAVGYKRGRSLYLTEVEGLLQLKPDLGRLDPVEVEKLEEKPKEELTQLQAKMRRRETLAERQRRENSYSHISKKERLEKWKPLRPVSCASRITEKVLEQLTTPVEKDVDVGLSREAFLTRVAPKRVQEKPAARPPVLADPKQLPKDIKIDEAVLSQLSSSVEALFAAEGVANLKDVRHCLRGGSLRDLAVVDDAVLHDALLKTKNVTCLRRVYLRCATGSTQTDPLRTILMGLVRTKETIRRNDVISAAKAKGVKITEKLFEAVMREICVSKDGGFWTMKTGRTT